MRLREPNVNITSSCEVAMANREFTLVVVLPQLVCFLPELLHDFLRQEDSMNGCRTTKSEHWSS
jgi:hypothetical protein